MKHLIVYRNLVLPPSETFIKQQIMSLRRWEALLVGQQTPENGLNLDGLKVLIINNFLNSRIHKLAWRLTISLGWPKFTKYQTLLDHNPSLIHTHFAIDAVAAWPRLKYLKIPMVVTLHGYDINVNPEWWSSGQGGEEMRYYPQQLRELADNKYVSFIAVSEAIRQKAIEAYLIPPDKIKVLYIGVNSKTFVPCDVLVSKRSPRVLFVGRLVEKKGASILINAMARVKSDMPEAELVIVGDGELRASLEDLAKQLNISVKFLGVLTNDQVREQMDQARIFCLPSITANNGDAEGLPIVILEAQASGLPVITSANGGRDEGISEGKTGFSFEEGDVDALSVCILRLLKDDELANNMSYEGPRFIADNFDLYKCSEYLEAHYDNLVLRKN